LDCDADESAAAAVFWGEGGAFCAGADLKALAVCEPLSGVAVGVPEKS